MGFYATIGQAEAMTVYVPPLPTPGKILAGLQILSALPQNSKPTPGEIWTWAMTSPNGAQLTAAVGNALVVVEKISVADPKPTSLLPLYAIRVVSVSGVSSPPVTIQPVGPPVVVLPPPALPINPPFCPIPYQWDPVKKVCRGDAPPLRRRDLEEIQTNGAPPGFWNRWPAGSRLSALEARKLLAEMGYSNLPSGDSMQYHKPYGSIILKPLGPNEYIVSAQYPKNGSSVIPPAPVIPEPLVMVKMPPVQPGPLAPVSYLGPPTPVLETTPGMAPPAAPPTTTQAQQAAAAAPSAPSWLDQEMIAGVPNKWLLLGVVALFLLMNKGDGQRA